MHVFHVFIKYFIYCPAEDKTEPIIYSYHQKLNFKIYRWIETSLYSGYPTAMSDEITTILNLQKINTACLSRNY